MALPAITRARASTLHVPTRPPPTLLECGNYTSKYHPHLKLFVVPLKQLYLPSQVTMSSPLTISLNILTTTVLFVSQRTLFLLFQI